MTQFILDEIKVGVTRVWVEQKANEHTFDESKMKIIKSNLEAAGHPEVFHISDLIIIHLPNIYTLVLTKMLPLLKDHWV